MISYGVKYYLSLHREELRLLCLKVQGGIQKNQVLIFSFTNAVLFLLLSQLFSPLNLLSHLHSVAGCLRFFLFMPLHKISSIRSFISIFGCFKVGYFHVL